VIAIAFENFKMIKMPPRRFIKACYSKERQNPQAGISSTFLTVNFAGADLDFSLSL
jgi:hypothetical protein